MRTARMSFKCSSPSKNFPALITLRWHVGFNRAHAAKALRKAASS